MSDSKVINIGNQFSRFPVGRYLADGNSNGQKFREEVLVPALAAYENIIVELDDALGYGSSFLEEAFGGLVRGGRKPRELLSRIKFVTEDDSLKKEIEQYIEDAAG